MRPKQNLAAVGFMLAATAFIAGTTVLAKFLGAGPDGLHPVQITQGRYLFAFLGFSAAAAVIRPRFTRPDVKIHALRSFAGFAGVTLMFAAVRFISLADATALTFTNPIFAMILAVPVLGERVGPWRWADLPGVTLGVWETAPQYLYRAWPSRLPCCKGFYPAGALCPRRG